MIAKNLLQVLNPAVSSSDPTGMPVTSGLTYRWRASAGVTQSSNLVTQWNDQAGTNHVYSGGYSPTYVSSFDRFGGNPSIRFAAGNVLAGTALTPFYGNTDRTVVVICRTLAAGDATYGDNIVSQSDAPIARYNAGSWPYYYPVALSTRGIHGWDTQPDSFPGEMPVKATQCLVWTHNSTGTLSTLRRNGTQVLSTTLNFTENQGYTVIGKGMQNSGHDIDADYADILVFNRVLTSGEIASIESWAVSYYKIDTSFDKVSLLLHMDGANGSTTFTDLGSNALTVTRYGSAAISTTASQFGGASVYFSGTTDKLSVPAGSLFQLSNFTIEFWVKCAANSNTYNTVLGGWSGAFNNAGNWAVRTRFGGVEQLALTIRNASTYTDITTGFSVSDNNWHYIAITRNGSTVTLYVDAVQKATGTNSTTLSATEPVTIGGSTGSISYESYYAGYLDELRISSVARTITLPTAPFPNS